MIQAMPKWAGLGSNELFNVILGLSPAENSWGPSYHYQYQEWNQAIGFVIMRTLLEEEIVMINGKSVQEVDRAYLTLKI